MLGKEGRETNFFRTLNNSSSVIFPSWSSSEKSNSSLIFRRRRRRQLLKRRADSFNISFSLLGGDLQQSERQILNWKCSEELHCTLLPRLHFSHFQNSTFQPFLLHLHPFTKTPQKSSLNQISKTSFSPSITMASFTISSKTSSLYPLSFSQLATISNQMTRIPSLLILSQLIFSHFKSSLITSLRINLMSKFVALLSLHLQLKVNHLCFLIWSLK